MADPAALAEAYRRGLLPPPQKAAYEEAMRRGLVAPAQPRLGVGEDMKRSALSGASEGPHGFLSGTLDALAGPFTGARKTVQAGLHSAAGAMQRAGLPPVLAGSLDMATDAMLGDPKQDPFGYHHEPQTLPGAYTKTAVEMAPNALFGNKASVAARVANVLAPAVASETAGQIAKGTPFEGAARMVGGVLGGVGAGARISRPGPPRITPQVVEEAGVPEGVLAKDAASAARYVAKKVPGKGLLDTTHPDKPFIAAEAMGKRGETMMGALARQDGTTADALQGKLSVRASEAPDRIQGDFAEAAGVHPEAAAGDLKGLSDSLRKEAGPLYDAAYAVGGVDTPGLRALVDRPSMRAAMARATRIAAEEGRNPSELGFVTERVKVPGGGSMDEVTRVQNPTAQTWDYVKRGLDDVMETFRDKTTGKLHLDESGKATLSTLQALRDELTTANPAYGAALGKAGEYLSMEDSFKAGGDMLLNGKVTEDQFANRFQALTDANKQAWLGGMANKVRDLAQNAKLGPKVFATPRVRAKLSAAIGPEAADRFIARAQAEATMARSGGQMAPNTGSNTANWGAEIKAQQGSGVLGEVGGDVARGLADGKPIRGVLGAVSRQGMKLVDGMTTGGLSEAARDEAGRLGMMSPEELAAYMKRLQDTAKSAQDASKASRPGVLGQLPPAASAGLLGSFRYGPLP